ncbi:MAG: hypothetical protein HGB12_17095, partial [Bacteroidetes bacterium]|nr:hypothetical protein [Bacteroidota bacterium]
SYLISQAINRGVPENTIVLLLLLPLVATLVSFLHYVVGVSGYGIFIPTMMAVAFLATGITGGLTLFAVILAVTLLSNIVLKLYLFSLKFRFSVKKIVIGKLPLTVYRILITCTKTITFLLHIKQDNQSLHETYLVIFS